MVIILHQRLVHLLMIIKIGEQVQSMQLVEDYD
jgi:hypothetical protein